MNKKVLAIILLFLVVLGLGGYKLYASRPKGISGLRVVSQPPTSIFLNDKLIGKTPYEDKHPPGEYILKLIPEEGSSQISSWQGKINLLPQVLTYVRRDLGTSELTSAGEIVHLEKLQDPDAQIAVFSTPDAAVVLLDGAEKGVTPLTIREAVPGEHDVAVNITGFTGRTVRVQTIPAFKVTVNFQLALSQGTQEATISGSGSPTVPPGGETEELKKPYVVIKDTETDFLRVRMGPSRAATEVAQLKPGQKVPYLEEQNGWYKVVYEENKEGWISGKYGEIVE